MKPFDYVLIGTIGLSFVWLLWNLSHIPSRLLGHPVMLDKVQKLVGRWFFFTFGLFLILAYRLWG